MKEIFTELNSIENVQGSLFFSIDGELMIYEAVGENIPSKEIIEEYSGSLEWEFINNQFKEINEAELIFIKHRVYIRKVDHGFILVLMTLETPIEVVRLNTDLLIPELDSLKKNKGFRRFFRFR
ncbi:MAG: hypothetical protein RBR53_07745 [Desulforegulaceae bacterium]|nr:hypothetical protein [Desulforegulaceae bacterium]